MKRLVCLSLVLACISSGQAAPMLVGNNERPLRYQAEGTDFVIENGAEFFNRPLYGTNTAFRVDASDRPECVLYLPGRGGNLRFGLKTKAGAKWLFDADRVVARYRPGSMLYEIHDTLLGAAVLTLDVIPSAKAEGLLVRVELAGKSADLELVCAFGGVNGQKGKRGGDIGAESQPVSEFFQLKPESCAGNEIAVKGSGLSSAVRLQRSLARSRPIQISSWSMLLIGHRSMLC